MRTCFLAGAHDAPDSIRQDLERIVEYMVRERRVTEFVMGTRGNFDAMAAAAVQRVLQRYPQNQTVALILEPYPFERRRRYVPAHFDGLFSPEGLETVPMRYRIEAANRKTLEGTDFFVTYVLLSGSSSGKLLRRARSLEKQGFVEVFDFSGGKGVGVYQNL